MTTSLIDVAMRPTSQVRRRFDELLIVRWVGASTRVIAKPSPDDSQRWPFIVAYTTGGCVDILRGSCVTRLSPNAMVLLANNGELRIDSEEDATLLLVHVPVGAVGPYGCGLSAAVGRVLDTRTGTPHLVARMLDGLSDDLDVIAPMRPGQLARHLTGFIALACEDSTADIDPTIGQAKEHIEHNLGDLDLGPNQVAHCLNVSVRTLHRAFEQESLSVAGWIRWRRLEHCRSELADRSYDLESVSVIGARWGFWDAAHFSKLFKTQYQLSPRAFRAKTMRQDVASAVSA